MASTPPAGSAGTVPWVLFGLKGRIGRQTYWLSYLLLVSLNSVVVAQVLGGGDASLSRPAAAIAPVVLFGTLFSNIACTVKRLHDFGMSGIFALALLVPVVNIAVTIWAGMVPGSPGPNRFGPGPDQPAP